MAINLGNVAGVVRGLNPPLEADGITEKRYVLWAKTITEEPPVYEVHYFNVNQNQWLSIESAFASIQSILNSIGDLTNLNTSDQTNLVNAINEVLTNITNIIDDVNESNSTTYSSSKIQDLIEALNNSIIGSADVNYDNLGKIQVAIENLQTASGSFIRYDQAQTLTTAQQAIAASNMGVYTKDEIGDFENTDLVAYFDTKLNDFESVL